MFIVIKKNIVFFGGGELYLSKVEVERDCLFPLVTGDQGDYNLTLVEDLE